MDPALCEADDQRRLAQAEGASADEIEAAERAAQLAALAQAEGLVQLREKPRVLVSAETERAMTGTG